MGENSKIEWTDHTMNFWIGCQEVSPACDFCYAKTQNNHRKWVNGWGPAGERKRTSAANWHKLRKWNREAGELGIRAKVFSNSLSDFFDNKVPATWRREAWHYIEQSPNLDFLILTKRPQNIPKMLPDPETGVKPWGDGWSNVWFGTTAENQEEADRRIPHLLKAPARVHFLSCEPLLGPLKLDVIDIDGHYEYFPLEGTTDCEDDDGNPVPDLPRIDWIIAGGESGPNARPSHPEWYRSLRDQCTTAGVPFFFKQWGDWAPYDRGRVDSETLATPKSLDAPMQRFGKKLAGATLDGRAHQETPNAP